MPWLALHIKTSDDHAALLSEQLTEQGALAITLQDDGNQPIYEPSASTPRAWKETLLTALFEMDFAITSIMLNLEKQKQQGHIQSLQLKTLADEDWVKKSLEDFKPLQFGKRLWICPSWLAIPDPEAINILLDPGLAFGTGTHPTTALCLEWLEAHMTPGSDVIDYGCGSGILGIAALKLGAKQVIAFDHDPQALEATRQNAYKNQIFDSLTTFFPTEQPFSPVDLVIANILAQPLIEIAPKLANYLKINGKIVLSGILIDQIDAVIHAYQPWFQLKNPNYHAEWACLVGIRANNN